MRWRISGAGSPGEPDGYNRYAQAKMRCQVIRLRSAAEMGGRLSVTYARRTVGALLTLTRDTKRLEA